MEYDEAAVEAFLAHTGALDENFLAHHGVLGMKWHHHKGGGEGGSKPSYKERKAGIIEARHKQIALRKQYVAAKKAGDEKGAAKLAEKFKNSDDRVTADHLTRGEKAVGLLLPGVGTQIVAGRTDRSTTLSKKGIAGRHGVALATTAVPPPLSGAAGLATQYAERKVLEKQINARKGK